MKELLSGNQALARGAWEAGVVVAAGYPGTPSTEILETLAPMSNVYAEWCPNEKVAMDVAVGAAYAGTRAMAVMKHVGLNVAADSYFYAAMTGLEAGLVIVVADDPGMHSSQGEQDTRRYAKFARVPILEPSDSQEAKDMVAQALVLSEQFDTPVLLRVTTRISHSFGVVELGEDRAPVEACEPYRIDQPKYVMVPGYARQRHPIVEARTDDVAEHANVMNMNRVEPGADASVGIVTCGVAYQYARDVFPEAPMLRLGMSWPIPKKLAQEFADGVDRLVVVEELDPVLEEELKLAGIPCEGKSIFPAVGELDPKVVRDSAIAAGLLDETTAPAEIAPNLPTLPPRPPLLCAGCPHRGIYAMARKLKLVVNGDIGCYTLGFLPPLSSVHTTGCMGASIGVAHGVAKAWEHTCTDSGQKNIAVIGDSTFFHTGIPALLNVAYNQSDTIVAILDNRTTAMTGHQQHPGTGKTLQEQPTPAIEIEGLVRQMGISEVHVVDPYDLKQVETTMRQCLETPGPAVIISRRECALLPSARAKYVALDIDPTKCVGCGLCLTLGCPAMARSETPAKGGKRMAVEIMPLLCTGCEMCAQLCPQSAISFREDVLARQDNQGGDAS